MSKGYKWIGGGLGWLIGGPLGGLLGFITGNLLEHEPPQAIDDNMSSVSELEACWIVIASHIIKSRNKVSLKSINTVRNFLISISGEENIDLKIKMLHHCLVHHYDLEKACGFIRIYHNETTAHLTLRLTFDLITNENTSNDKEWKLLFRIAGLLNINDVVYRKLIESWQHSIIDDYQILGLSNNATTEQVRSAYRRLVLQIHPDRNAHYTHDEKKQAELRLQQIREAYQRLTHKFEN